MNDIFVRIKFLMPTLPKTEKIVANYLFNESEAVRGMTLAILSQEIGCSEATIIRLCKRLGYDGFSSMKQDLLVAMVDKNVITTQEIKKNDSVSEIIEKIIKTNTQTLKDTLTLVSDDYEKALQALLKAKSIHFFGIGDAFVVAQLALMKFSRLGYSGSAHSDVMLQLITASSLTNEDVAFAISYSGASKTLIDTMKIAKENNAITMCITRMSKSPLLKYTDFNMFTPTADLTVGKDIISRRVADQAIIDSLYLGVLIKSEERYLDNIRKTQKAIDHNKVY